MNEKESFIIEDLDDFHVVIKADEEWRVRRDLETEVSLFCRYESLLSTCLSFSPTSSRRTRTALNSHDRLLALVFLVLQMAPVHVHIK